MIGKRVALILSGGNASREQLLEVLTQFDRAHHNADSGPQSIYNERDLLVV